MARLPDKSSRFVLISVFLFCTTFLFLDFKFNTFKPVQNFYSSSSIFVKIFSKEYIFVPIYSSLISNFDTQKVKEENRILKAELNEQLIMNYILSNKNILNQNTISEKFDSEKVNLWFKANKPEIVVLAAAKVGGIGANSNFPSEFLLENIKIQFNVISIQYRSCPIWESMYLGL